ncbi:phosphate ABC-transporter periplasmic phosphate-binding protein [Gloeothece citriformis PCC 7424]|uniref:Phosphate ABC-transporter periplasmic phosphate-binding protein n=1 Tax=Gloeothece citriformis (strain PCC 7424) TaxID=65393 RepID=B7K6Y2_GLOC7|nr:PstS family phosphate ABC transporter substrate-binding protein [Gloeothece citriformis]ACK72681.1 phosphate ABC-transporter periplasmic phosphate-binding protein [Gloeothece citriformis PCC 7424]
MLKPKNSLFMLISLLLTAGLITGISGLTLLKLGVISPENFSIFSTGSSFSDLELTTVADLDEVENIPEGLFNYGGSTSWIPIQTAVNPIIEVVFPRFILRYTKPVNGKPGSGTGIKMLLNNQLSFSLSSRSLKAEEYQQGKNQGLTLKEIPVAIDAIAIAVHPELNLSGLTISQLKQIYRGKIINWSQVGGPDLPITPYSRSALDSGTVEFFGENVLENEAFSDKVIRVATTTEGLQKLSQNRGGIYYASAPEIIPQCTIKALSIGRNLGEWISPYQEPFIPLSQCPTQRNQVNKAAFRSGDYPITRRLFVIVKRNNSIDAKAGIAYANLLLTQEGQNLINRAGFVSLR